MGLKAPEHVLPTSSRPAFTNECPAPSKGATYAAGSKTSQMTSSGASGQTESLDEKA
jgi:hypothetical protein